MSIRAVVGGPAAIGGVALRQSIPSNRQVMTVASTASTVTAQPGDVWTIYAMVDVYVEFGAAPSGAGPLGYDIPAKTEAQFAATIPNEKVAFVTT